MVATDKIKSSGRREAWSRDDSGWTWNPFARGNGRRRGIGGVNRASTDLEDHYRREPRAPPNHASTSPTDHSSSQPYDIDPESKVSQRPQSIEGDTQNQEIPDSQDPLAESKTIENDSQDDKYANEGKYKNLYRRLFLDDPVPFGQQIKQVLFPHWYTINYLLIASPVGIGLHFVKGINPLVEFIVNFIAIVPLAGILSFATEEIALRVGEVIGGLLNASFG
jgi:Ca2+:H+ antiporter